MGAVYRGRQLRLERRVAIKVLLPALAAEAEYVARFLREAKAASQIKHRNVVRIIDYGQTEDGCGYSVMEYLEGQDLQRYLMEQPGQRISWERAWGLLEQIAAGLKAVHGRGVIHRDVKPANCFLTHEDGEEVVKLVDFGIAKVDDRTRDRDLTGADQVLGTPGYTAPEVLCGPATHSSDIYALGVVAYRMLMGQVPFRGKKPRDVLRSTAADPVPPLRDRLPDLPPEVEAFVLELLAKQPRFRPPDMQTVQRRLAKLGRDTLGSGQLDRSSSEAQVTLIESMQWQGGTDDTTLAQGIGEGNVGSSIASSSLGVPTPVAATHVPAPVGPFAAVVVGGPERAAMMTDDELETAETVVMDRRELLPPIVEPASQSGETVIALDEATLHGMEQSGALDREPRRRRWLGWLGSGVLVAAGAWAWAGPGMQERGGVDGARMAAKSDEEPRMTAEPPSPARPGPALLQAPKHAPRLPGTSPAASSPRSTEASARPPESRPPASSPRSPEASPPPLESRPRAPAPSPRAPASSPRPSRPEGPPSDASMERTLKRRINRRCIESPDHASLTVGFAISAEGEVKWPFASPPGHAATCAIGVVKKAVFRPRPAETKLEFTVE